MFPTLPRAKPLEKDNGLGSAKAFFGLSFSLSFLLFQLLYGMWVFRSPQAASTHAPSPSQALLLGERDALAMHVDGLIWEFTRIRGP